MIRKLGFQQKMIGLFLLLFVPVVALCIWQQIQYYGLMRQNVSEYTMQLIDKISYDIERGIKELDSALMEVLYDVNTSMLLQSPQNEQAARAVAFKMTDAKSMLRMKTVADCNIVLLSNDRKVVASTYDEWTGSNRALGSEWLDKINRAKGGRVIVSAYSIRRESGSTAKVVGIARSVQSEEERQGILLLEIPVDYFYSFCNGVDFGSGGYLMLVDNDDYILYSTNTKQIGSRFTMADELALSAAGIIERQSEFVYGVSLSVFDHDLQTVAVVSRAQMEADIDAMFRQMLFVIGVLGLFLLLISIISAKSFCRPILSISQAMKQLESGHFQARVLQTSTDELGDLQRGFNHMAKQLGEFVEREYVSIVREREAQLKDLIRMMDPHFMYNTLEAISMTAYLNNDQQAVQMLDRLADMYRFSSGQGERITLREELKNAKDYLYLIDIRYDGKVRFHQDIDESLLECECLKFSLQPLIENCVVHGFSEVQNEGDIWLTIRNAEPQSIEILIKDNGIGLSESQLLALCRIIADDKIEIENYPSMAVKNIHDRLRLTYGAAYGITVCHAPHGGAQVRLIFPRIRKEGFERDNGNIGG